ncbi:DNA cytosine methyltransferase [Candidatus Nitrosacidococcus sp. I8]|uniref:DNA cytosine methyltransferase n=1 Tax=Candidatus Nitrosacidococcus sp. I8 TaxID=2942908 RepID=UPI0039B6F4E2
MSIIIFWCWGLDLGFKNAGFEVIWANEFDKSIWETFQTNFPYTELDKRSITQIKSEEIPEVDGFIGGPPCQSWSEAGARRGIHDSRGKLFHDYIRLLKNKKPRFFLAENVAGILHPKHAEAFSNSLIIFENAGFDVSYRLLNAHDFNVPQDRKRVIIIDYWLS